MKIEKDEAQFLAGLRGGVTLGSPIALVVWNKDHENWKELVSPYARGGKKFTQVRPGHADLAGALKYGLDDARDVLERASARSTAATVALGSLAKQLLARFGVAGHLARRRDRAAPALEVEGPPDAAPSRPPSRRPSCTSTTRRSRRSGGRSSTASGSGAAPSAAPFEVYARGSRSGSAATSTRTAGSTRGSARRSAASRRSAPSRSATARGSTGRATEFHDADPLRPGARLLPRDQPRRRARGRHDRRHAGPRPRLHEAHPHDAHAAPDGGPRDARGAQARYERSDVCAVPAAAVVGEAVVAWELADALLEKFGGDAWPTWRRRSRPMPLGSAELLALAGMMGSGKSTVARAPRPAARAARRPLDDEIVRAAGKPIPAIFAEDGEPAFRALERAAVAALPAGSSPTSAAAPSATRRTPRSCSRSGAWSSSTSPRAEAARRPHRRRRRPRPLAASWEPLLARAPAALRARPPRASRWTGSPPRRWRGGSWSPCDRRRSEAHPRAPGRARYEVRVGEGAADGLAALAAGTTGSRWSPARACCGRPSARRRAGAARSARRRWRSSTLLPDGERGKTLRELERAAVKLLRAGRTRRSLVVSLGGGAVSDAAGFLAATFMRGVAWAAAPTTLLSMVDAAIGGKTGVNLPVAKNAVGAFHPPSAVLADPAALATLPARELRSGMGEVLKYAALEPALLGAVGRRSPAHGRRSPALIAACARAKVGVVAADPTEQGARKLLNLGHTFGHGVEAAGAFERYTHGEAVAVGPRLRVPARGAARPDRPARRSPRWRRRIAEAGLPVRVPGGDRAARAALMAFDKKRTAAGLRWVLPRADGAALDGGVGRRGGPEAVARRWRRFGAAPSRARPGARAR